MALDPPWNKSSRGQELYHKWNYLKRVFRMQQLEFDSAFQQLRWILLNPKRVFRSHKDRNAMRGYWARDDPALLLIVLVYLAVATIGYSLWLRLGVRFFLALLWVLLGDCLVAGAIVASIMWVVSNKFMRLRSANVKPVEWAYCFDVHLNAFIPLALLIYGVQLLLWPLMSSHSIISVMFTNTIWLMALCHYVYLTFLGYTVLPSMTGTTSLLGTTLLLALLYLIAMPFKWNAALIFKTIFTARCGA